MPTADERLIPVGIKIERAKEHIRDLEARLTAFKGRDPYEVVSHIDAKTGEQIFRFRKVYDIPTEISLRTGEVLQNLRSALDYIVCALVESKTPGGTTRFTGFPIFPSPDDYKGGRLGKIQGMSDRAMDAIDLTEPYKGGTDALWHLRKLNDREKHRLLLTAAIAFNATTSQRLGGGMFVGPGRPGIMRQPIVEVKLTERVFPVKDRAVIGIAPSQMNMNPKYTFEVAFNEPGIIEGEPILPTIYQLTNLVEGIVANLKAFLS